MTSLDSILKSRDITLPTNVHVVRAMFFPVVMYGCESWTIKKAECQRINAFEMWCWRRLLRVSWTARRSNQWILEEIRPEYSLEGLMLELKLQIFGHLKWRTDPAAVKRLKVGEGNDRGWDGWMTSPMRISCVWVGPRSFGYGQGGLGCCSPCGCKESDTTEWLNWTSNWRTKKKKLLLL